MEKKNCYALIHVGLCIRLLMNANASTAKKNYVVTHIDKLAKGLEAANLTVSITGMNDIEATKKEIAKLKDDELIGTTLASKLQSQMSIFEKIVFAESSTKDIYVLPPRRFNSDYLINAPEKLFKKDVFNSLPDLARTDISSACRCLLYGEATAAAFHILRAAEDVLKQYYFDHKKTKRLNKPMWGPMCIELKALKRNPPPKVLLDSLDLVRNSYRNPTQHPEAVYDIETAQDLFGVCIDLVNKMVSVA